MLVTKLVQRYLWARSAVILWRTSRWPQNIFCLIESRLNDEHIVQSFLLLINVWWDFWCDRKECLEINLVRWHRYQNYLLASDSLNPGCADTKCYRSRSGYCAFFWFNPIGTLVYMDGPHCSETAHEASSPANPALIIPTLWSQLEVEYHQLQRVLQSSCFSFARWKILDCITRLIKGFHISSFSSNFIVKFSFCSIGHCFSFWSFMQM